MMWKPVASLGFHVVLIVVLAGALILSLDWPSETALFPQAVGAPILALTLISFGFEIARFRRGGAAPVTMELVEGTEAEDWAFLARAGVEFAWMVGFGLAIWVVGFYPASFLFLLLYLTIRAKLGIGKGLIWSASAIVAIFVIFYLLLRLDPYRGLIGDLMG